ncbi:hypothetical protein [Chryseobacterium sp.]|uniref:hypothetical protein n=1 Tax=Chryseobacterium sp. TaxID=1871047 RepID=UPI0031D38C9D
MEEIYDAKLILNGEAITHLIRPKLYEKKGRIKIDCFLDSDSISYSDFDFFLKNNPEIILNKEIFKIIAYSKQGKIEFYDVMLSKTSYPGYEFTFTCLQYSLLYAGVDTTDLIENSVLTSFTFDSMNIQFTNASTIKRERKLFDFDDSRPLSIDFDSIELPLNLWFKKRYFDLKIALIKHPKREKSIIVKFFGESKIPYRIYKKLKFSIKYFISYLAGNNVIIKEENFYNNNYGYFVKTHSEPSNKRIFENEYLPIYDPGFKHKKIVSNYLETLSLYLFLDKKINLSDIIYLINQAKKVDIESGFFILLICIEKLSRLLVESELIPNSEKTIIPKQIFDSIKKPLFESFEELAKNTISKDELSAFKSKINNLNTKGKTDYKIDLLLDFAEIERTDEINLLFPYLRNLAIHEGEISSSENDHYKNFYSLFNLVNEIICNLIQYRGVRRPKSSLNSRILVIKKEYEKNYKTNIGFVNHQ